MRMNRLFLALFVGALVAITSCSKQSDVELRITNKSKMEGLESMVELPIKSLKIDVKSGDNIVVKSVSGEVVPSQITYDGNLIFQLDVAPSQSASVFVSSSSEALSYEPKVYGRLVRSVRMTGLGRMTGLVSVFMGLRLRLLGRSRMVSMFGLSEHQTLSLISGIRMGIIIRIMARGWIATRWDVRSVREHCLLLMERL